MPVLMPYSIASAEHHLQLNCASASWALEPPQSVTSTAREMDKISVRERSSARLSHNAS